MEDLLSYRLEDLILFSSRTFNRMFQVFADEMLVWNLALYVAGIGLFATIAIWKHPRAYQFMLLYLAICWGYIGSVFLKQYYVPLNPLLSVAIYAFYAQAMALSGFALYKRSLSVSRVNCLLAAALVSIPLAGVALGNPYMQAQAFGAGPDSVMLLTLLTLRLPTQAGKLATLLYLIPVLWLVLSLLTFLGLE